MAFQIQFFVYEHTQKICTRDFINQMTFNRDIVIWDWPYYGWYDHIMGVFDIKGQFIVFKSDRNLCKLFIKYVL